MTTVCYAIYSYVLNALTTKQFSQISESLHNHAILLQNSTPSIPSGTNELTLKTLAQRLGTQFSAQLLNNLPNLSHINKLERFAWSLAANGSLNLISSTNEQIHECLMNNRLNDSLMENSNTDDVSVCREALECLSLSLCLVPNALETLNQEKHWRTFIVDLVLMCGNRIVRQTASEQFLLIALKCSQQINRPLQFFIQMLFTCLHTLNKENAQQSQEYFYLLCRLLNCANVNNVQINNTETLLNNEITWLKKVKQTSFAGGNSNPQSNNNNNNNNKSIILNEEIIDEMLLDGHLGITKELLLFQNAEKKFAIGCQLNGSQLINDFVEYFIFPASYLFKKYRDSLIATNSVAINNFEQLLASKSLKSICNTSMTTVSAFDLLISLCTGCLANFQALSDLLFQLFYPSLLPSSSSVLTPPTNKQLMYSSNDNNNSIHNNNNNNNQLTNDCTIAQNEWEYMPPIGQRPHNGFVGLKNAGATCYMNSVLQQLFMIKNLRNFILSIETQPFSSETNHSKDGCNVTNNINNSTSVFDDLDDTDAITTTKSNDLLQQSEEIKCLSEEDQRKEYNMNIFKNLQMIFGHLAESKMQYYVPKGFWRQFRFGGGERVNLREQHDAVEFFNSVVDCIDESMKSIQKEQICSKVLGGTFADQKICKGCPHKYSREESFTLLSVDVKHSQRLTESLEQYVKGDLLEGPNAYHCEKCNKKIDAIKRTCIKKLPAVLAIQLKRFDYDWEREIAVKSNEYFEFPRELDMQPYTVRGVANLEKQQELLKQQQDLKLKQQQQQQQVQTTPKQDLDNNKTITVVESPAEIKINEHDLSDITKTSEIDPDEDEEEEEDEEDESSKESIYTNKYKLVGIVVHSGQANGGHYYSFIQNKSIRNEDDDSRDETTTSSHINNNLNNSDQENNWYKFDDGDVSEFKMDDDELRNQCFGGDYTGEVYDNIMKRMAYKKQKRWWNAYILFYERLTKTDQQQQLQLSVSNSINETFSNTSLLFNKQRNQSGDSSSSVSRKTSKTNSTATFTIEEQKPIKIPSFILKSVHKKNIKFLHHRHHFSGEYFQFIKKLSQANLYLCQNDTPMVFFLF
jgi:ubiquitin carboxyl-terminal hydrolase 9/24